jgi:hypothetical protein
MTRQSSRGCACPGAMSHHLRAAASDTSVQHGGRRCLATVRRLAWPHNRAVPLVSRMCGPHRRHVSRQRVRVATATGAQRSVDKTLGGGVRHLARGFISPQKKRKPRRRRTGKTAPTVSRTLPQCTAPRPDRGPRDAHGDAARPPAASSPLSGRGVGRPCFPFCNSPTM